MERGGIGHKRNARERTRVHTVNKAFHILKHHLPALRIHSKRVSKLRILKAAIVYINSLMDTVGTHYEPSLPARDSARRTPSNRRTSQQSGIHTLAANAALVTAPSKNPPPLDMPYLRSLIDSAPYVPQFSAFSVTNNTSIGNTNASASPNEFASILSSATANLGYSYPWNTYHSS